MRLRYKIGLIVIAVSFAVCLMTFQSYALWIKDMVAEQNNVVEVGCFQIQYEEATGTEINLLNTYPVSDQKGLTGKPYTFTITNVCSIDDSYIVTLNTSKENQKGEEGQQFQNPTTEENVDSYNMKDKIKFALSHTKGKEDENTDSNKPRSGTNLGTYTTQEGNLNQDTSELKDVEDIDESIVLDKGTLKGRENEEGNGGSVTYHLYLWFDENAGNEIMGQSFKASVNIIHHASYETEEELPLPGNDEEQGGQPN